MTSEAVNSVQCLYFSPTGSTRRIVETVAKGTRLPVIAPISITTPRERNSYSGQIDGDLLMVGVPVYAGRIPSFVLSPLSKVDGAGRWALPVAVCGNVLMGTCLAELCAVLKRQGFTIPAAGNFIAQHSFACEFFPIAKGRPDENDLRQAAEFGQRVVAKIAQDAEDITCVYGGSLYIRMYVSGSTEATGFVSIPERHRATIVDAVRTSARLAPSTRNPILSRTKRASDALPALLSVPPGPRRRSCSQQRNSRPGSDIGPQSAANRYCSSSKEVV